MVKRIEQSGETFSWLQIWAYWKRLELDKNYGVMRNLWLGIGYEKGRGDGGLKYILIDSVSTFPSSVLEEMFLGCPDSILKMVRSEVPEEKKHLVRRYEPQDKPETKKKKGYQTEAERLSAYVSRLTA